MALDRVCRKNAMNPETVKSYFLSAYDIYGAIHVPLGLDAKPRQEPEQFLYIPSCNKVLRSLLGIYG
jgi:hypothetical protein